MDLAGFRKYLNENKEVLQSWGNFVQTQVNDAAKAKLVNCQITSCRVKEIESAVGKIARKNYQDPLMQMEDLVGVRFVVLLSPDVATISSILEDNEYWNFSKERDVEVEIQAAPDKFDYQSCHYVVRAKKEIEYGGVLIPAKLPCEVQIRTLLQHTYAEVVHDSIYKAVGPVPVKASRFAHSSMALIETTDHLFCETMRLLEEENSVRNRLLKELSKIYIQIIGNPGAGHDEKLNLYVLDCYRDHLPESIATDIQKLLDENKFIAHKIQERIASDPFWSQPVSLLAYWLVEKHSMTTFGEWPLASSHDALQLIYSDLGKAAH
jgi:putative GTP pyrophosphokinase